MLKSSRKIIQGRYVMPKIIEYSFNGYAATVITPDKPNGKWIWKTEFLYAFDKAEQALVEDGYTRVNYKISDMYGSYNAVRLMHAFHLDLLTRFPLCKKTNLFGFSRGGLYAFNYSLFYPEYVDKVYLDAPVLDLASWPWEDSPEQAGMLEEYCLTKDTLKKFRGSPVYNFKEFFSNELPLLVVAGGSDEVVKFEDNAGKLIDYAKKNGENIKYIVKPECGHHPHSLDDVTPILDFIEKD